MARTLLYSVEVVWVTHCHLIGVDIIKVILVIWLLRNHGVVESLNKQRQASLVRELLMVGKGVIRYLGFLYNTFRASSQEDLLGKGRRH